MTNANGSSTVQTARKSLSDQIDRLDDILDGLADALNESVADAVKDVISQVVRDAVEAAVKEVLASPDLLRAALEKHAPPPQPKPPSLTEKLASAGTALCAKAKQAARLARRKLRPLGAVLRAGAQQAAGLSASLPRILGAVGRGAWALRKPCAVAVAVGVVCGAACYLGGRLFSSVVNGVSGAALALSAMTLPLKRVLGGGNPRV